ncbi:hypothetical protein DIPPA_17922 [Diplonema papillatum]|nr:hypothetical protein DIPPA_17922 [Diplonema papillatum]
MYAKKSVEGPSDDARKWMCRIVYLVGASFYVIGAQEVYYTGAGSMKTFLPPMPYFIGMTLVALLPPQANGTPPQTPGAVEEKEKDKRNVHKVMLRIAMLEATGYLTTYLGIAYAGSTVYTIVYGSMSLVVALVRWLITGRTVSKAQLAGILVAVVGISSTALEGLNAPNAVSIETGVFFTLVGCFAYATEFVYLEDALTFLPTTTILFTLGKYCTLFFFTLFITVGLPHHRAWLDDQIAAHHGRVEVVVLLYVLLVPCSFLKNYAWLGVIKGDGAVVTGLMQGFRSCFTFAVSAMCFCSPATPTQCFSYRKGFATVLVVAGTLIYSFASPGAVNTVKLPSRRTPVAFDVV